MNDTKTNEGGWAASGMRSYLNSTVAPLIPSAVSNRIVSVNKVTDLSSVSLDTSVDSVWIPSKHEIVASDTDGGSESPTYSEVLSDASDRIKLRYNNNMNRFIESRYWLRTPSVTNQYIFWDIKMDGSAFYSNANTSEGVALGFCLD